MCEVDCSCNFSSGVTYVRPCSLSKISQDKCRDHWRWTKLRTGQKTCTKKIVPNCIYSSPEAITSPGFGLGKISPYDKLFANLTLLWSSLWWRDFVGAATLGKHTTLHSIIPHKIFLQRAMKSFRVFLELVKALQKAKTAIAANIAFHIYTRNRNIQFTTKFCFRSIKFRFPFWIIFFKAAQDTTMYLLC